MAATTDLLVDGFGRIRDNVAGVLDGLDDEVLAWRPDPSANTVAWLVWHLTRIQDDHLAGAFGLGQLWEEEGWAERMALPFSLREIGYGQSSEEVGQVRVGAALLLGYHEVVYERTVELVSGVSADDLDRIVDRRWNPPVTLAVRLVSVIADDLEHVGQAAYVRGMAERAGAR